MIDGRSGEIGQCNCSNKGLCKVSVKGAVPEWVEKMHSTTPKLSGPNCFNSALVAAKILPSVRFSREEEIIFWLKSPLCRELDSGESPSPGDIVAIRANDNTLDHAFIYISEELSFSKNGEDAPYLLQSPSSVFSLYNVGPECSGSLKLRPGSGGCANYANYFRCGSYSQFAQNMDTPTDWKDSDQQIRALEEKIEIWSITGKIPKKEIFSNIFRQLSASVQIFFAKMSAAQGGERFFWQSLYYRTDSALQTLRIIGPEDLTRDQ